MRLSSVLSPLLPWREKEQPEVPVEPNTKELSLEGEGMRPRDRKKLLPDSNQEQKKG